MRRRTTTALAISRTVSKRLLRKASRDARPMPFGLASTSTAPARRDSKVMSRSREVRWPLSTTIGRGEEAMMRSMAQSPS